MKAQEPASPLCAAQPQRCDGASIGAHRPQMVGIATEQPALWAELTINTVSGWLRGWRWRR